MHSLFFRFFFQFLLFNFLIFDIFIIVFLYFSIFLIGHQSQHFNPKCIDHQFFLFSKFFYFKFFVSKETCRSILIDWKWIIFDFQPLEVWKLLNFESPIVEWLKLLKWYLFQLIKFLCQVGILQACLKFVEFWS